MLLALLWGMVTSENINWLEFFSRSKNSVILASCEVTTKVPGIAFSNFCLSVMACALIEKTRTKTNIIFISYMIVEKVFSVPNFFDFFLPKLLFINILIETIMIIWHCLYIIFLDYLF